MLETISPKMLMEVWDSLLFLPHCLLFSALPLISTLCLLGQRTAGCSIAEITFKVAAFQHRRSRDVIVTTGIASPACRNNSSTKVKPMHPTDLYWPSSKIILGGSLWQDLTRNFMANPTWRGWVVFIQPSGRHPTFL